MRLAAAAEQQCGQVDPDGDDFVGVSVAVDAERELEAARALLPVDARRVHLVHDLLERRVLQVEREADHLWMRAHALRVRVRTRAQAQQQKQHTS